ncbi:MAG: hypothetical protein K0U29_00345 [Gammaproteobacteria bacterium]|nr:hypothetical protein [Gammaproteobacteria bacterium]
MQSLGVHLVSSPNKARYGLYFMGSNLTHNQANISNSNQSTSVSFTLTTQIKLTDRNGDALLGPLSFSASSSQTLNADQIYTTTIDSGAKQQLQQNVISSIYYWLTSDEVKQALRQTYANKHKTTQQHNK